MDTSHLPKRQKILYTLIGFILHLLYLLLIILRLTKSKDITIFAKGIQDRTSENKAERLIIIDDDVGFYKDGVWKQGHYFSKWIKLTDPDGGLELIYGLREPNVRILGITIMMGVAPTSTCVQAAKNVLKVLGRSKIPVLKGARSPSDLGKETEAARFIIDQVKKNPGKVEIVATGPLTNIATAMRLEPELPKLWRCLHFATGEFRRTLGETSDLYGMLLLGVPDLNINVDVKATNYVLKHGGAFPIYCNEIMDDIIFNRRDYNQVLNAKTSIGNYVAYELKVINFIYNHMIPLGKGLIPHGVVPIALALDPTYKSEWIESAVVMKSYGYQGFAFELSDDPKLPKHKVHFKLSDDTKKRMHRELITRLI